jgi:hypothetical protein
LKKSDARKWPALPGIPSSKPEQFLRIRRTPYFAKNRETSAARREGSCAVADAMKDYLAEIKAEKARPRCKERSMSSMPGSCRNSAPIQIEQLATDRIDRWRDKLATQPSACAVSAPRWSRPPARQPTICQFYGLARDERVVFNYR